MKKKLTFLGIETSCDETAAAVVKENSNGTADVLSNVVSSQIKEHEKFGGVVPEIAARAHVENIDFIINRAIKLSGKNISSFDGIASTAGPGLVVCLNIGYNIGKSIASFKNKLGTFNDFLTQNFTKKSPPILHQILSQIFIHSFIQSFISLSLFLF